jgi:GT2 family glycosyltransferase
MYLYIIDNSPTDYLRYEFPIDINHEYIHLPSNPGFGKAHNLAIRKAQEMQSDYHLVINADVHFDFDVLSPMLLYMEANLKVGQMMPKILNTDGTIQRLCKLVPTPADLLFRRLANKITRDSRNKYFELHDFGYDKIMFVPYLSGCFMLLRQKSLLDVGIFDERFFMYPEDIDLTRRIAEKYETLFFPDVFVIHEHGAASHKSLKMFFIHAINIVKYFNKWGWFFDSFRDDINKKTLTQFDLL